MLSRVADSLYWIARYLERAEHTARVIDVNLQMMLDQAGDDGQRWPMLLKALSCELEDVPDDAYRCTHALTFDERNPNSIRACIANAREAARQVREQVSNEMFEQLNSMYFSVRQTALDDIWSFQPFEFFRSIRQGAHLFHGVTDATINHDQGWQFIQLGRSLERVIGSATMMRVYLGEDPPDSLLSRYEARSYLNWVALLRACMGYEAYLRKFRQTIERRNLAEFLLIDRAFPRSVGFAAQHLLDAVQQIAAETSTPQAAALERTAGRLAAKLMYADIDELLNAGGGLDAFLAKLIEEAEQMNNHIDRTFIAYPIADSVA